MASAFNASCRLWNVPRYFFICLPSSVQPTVTRAAKGFRRRRDNFVTEPYPFGSFIKSPPYPSRSEGFFLFKTKPLCSLQEEFITLSRRFQGLPFLFNDPFEVVETDDVEVALFRAASCASNSSSSRACISSRVNSSSHFRAFNSANRF